MLRKIKGLFYFKVCMLFFFQQNRDIIGTNEGLIFNHDFLSENQYKHVSFISFFMKKSYKIAKMFKSKM